MTDLDALKAMLTKAEVKFEVTVDDFGDEIDVEFTPDLMDEEILFVFSYEGELKEVM